ncbi:MAG: phosphoribosylanthranilate isomerase [Bacteroidetes bacterium]|nr:MAG: phosphoribosylanthranilate isomerase [Bacteroidota bacterium]
MDRQKDLQIKVCGMRDPLNLEQVCALLPEFVGFIFYPRSKRFVGTHPDPMLFEIPGPAIKKVGVFVDEELSQLRKTIEIYGLDAVQLHGGESAEYCRQLSGEAVQVIKALDPQVPFMEFEIYMEVVDLLLFDSGGAGKGGTGQKFDWELLESLSLPTPFLLSGGIGPGDAGLIRALDLQGLTGVDVNSRFELSPGLKDIEKLKGFFIEIRK